MIGNNRENFDTWGFPKARVFLVVLKDIDMISEIASKYEIHPNQVSKWKAQAEELLKTGFSKKDQSTPIKEKVVDIVIGTNY